MKKIVKLLIFIFVLILNMNCLASLDSAPSYESIVGLHAGSFTGYETYTIRSSECTDPKGKSSACKSKGRFFAIKQVSVDRGEPYYAYCSGTIKENSPSNQTSSGFVGKADNTLALILESGYPNASPTGGSDWRWDYYVTQSAVWLYLNQSANWGGRYDADNWKSLSSRTNEDYSRYYVYWLVQNAKDANARGEKATYDYYIYSFTNRQNLLIAEPIGVDVEEQGLCSENSSTVKGKTNQLTDACNVEDTSFNDELKSTCQVKKTDYYERTCKETVSVTANPSINGYTKKINYTVDYSGKLNCEFTFKHDKWKEDYNTWIAKGNLNNCDERCKASIQANINTLDSMVIQYQNMIKNLKYDFKPTAYINNKSNSFTLTQEDNSSHNQEVLNNVVSSNCQTLNGKNVCNYKFKEGDELLSSGFLELTNPITITNPDKVNFTLYVEGLGSHSLWKVNGVCNTKIEVELGNYFYREIDIKNPFDFRSKADECTDAGGNWCNSNYNYINVIKNSIDDDDILYSFSLTRENIKAIQELNRVEKLSSNGYNGVDCEYKGKNLRCSFIRDSKYFAERKIKGE